MSFIIGILAAKEMVPGTARKAYESPLLGVSVTPTREVPPYTFTKLPTTLMTSYYDYMIGSYNGIPLRVIPDVAGGGYFMSYHGSREAEGQRRVFYAHLSPAGNVLNNNEITGVSNREGYSTVAVDPVSGKPLYAWHANHDTESTFLEIQFTSDAFFGGISGLFNDLQMVVDNPFTITPTNGVTPTSDNEFIWPTAQIGPSPVAGKRRIYLANRNSATHTYGPSENLLLAYADFDENDVENAVPFQWTLTTIPEMDNWNHDSEWRRPFHSLITDNAGNVYYAGYHFATESDGTTNIEEPSMDVFKCPNYGEGTWTRVSEWERLTPTWNPAGTLGGTGYFVGDGDVPYPDNELFWGMANSSHLNAVVDTQGRILVPALWCMSTEGGYWPDYHNVKTFIFDPATGEFEVKEIYPKKNPADNFNTWYTPWDWQAPWGEAEYVEDEGTYYLQPEKNYPFPHWDDTLHDAMFFHYNNIKLSEPNDQGMLVAVWQDSQRARWANVNSDPDYLAFANTPEIYISVSPNNGDWWSEPIVINNVETTEFAGIKPMWVYPADKVIYVDTVDNHKIGKIGLMYYDDFTWGSFSIDPPAHPANTGGNVSFMELQITFPIPPDSNEDNVVVTAPKLLNQNFPNPFNPETTISFDMPKAGNARLDIYNVKGQLVKNLFNGNAPYGKTNLVWNGTDNSGRNVPSGIYFYRLNTNGRSETRKMMLMK